MPSYLKRVSLTGADDATSLDLMIQLGQEFSFLEWALLYVPGKEGMPRNPSRKWREAYFSRPTSTSTAVHLCGSQAFEELLWNHLPSDVLKADRLQLNVNARRADFDNIQLLAIYRKAMKLGPSIILQRHEFTSNVLDYFIGQLSPQDLARVSVLVDDSRGTGTRPAVWTVPDALRDTGVELAFAGGMGPLVMADVLPQLDAFRIPYGVDMESGIRTNNLLDVRKARATLVACQPFAQNDRVA